MSSIPDGFGSHLPVLRWLLEVTDGPILEVGGGKYSTPLFSQSGRELVTVEEEPKWRDEMALYHRGVVTDTIPTEGSYSIVFIDHEPESIRRQALDSLEGRYEVAVVHDVWKPGDARQRYPGIWTPAPEGAWWFYPRPAVLGPPTMVFGIDPPEELPDGRIVK